MSDFFGIGDLKLSGYGFARIYVETKRMEEIVAKMRHICQPFQVELIFKVVPNVKPHIYDPRKFTALMVGIKGNAADVKQCFYLLASNAGNTNQATDIFKRAENDANEGKSNLGQVVRIIEGKE